MPTVTDFTQVEPGVVYTVADVQRLMGASENTVLKWIADLKLLTLPRLGRGRHRILGSALLALLGDQAETLKPAASETANQRKDRVADDGEQERADQQKITNRKLDVLSGHMGEIKRMLGAWPDEQETV